MKKYFAIVLPLFFLGCNSNSNQLSKSNQAKMSQTNLKNEKARNQPFLQEMFRDDYFPNVVVEKGKDILVELCFQIEEKKPKNLPELYQLTHAATDKFNDLEQDFEENGSEIETGAREAIGMDFYFIAMAYGYENADPEMLIVTRDW